MELPDDVDLEADPTVVDLATLRLSNGNSVVFSGSYELLEAGCSENVAEGGAPLISNGEQVNCLDLYTKLTPAGTPVPQLLRTVFGDEAQDGAQDRPVLTAAEGALELELEAPDRASSPFWARDAQDGWAHSCPSSDNHWRQVHCSFSGGSAVIAPTCHAGRWVHFIQGTNSKRRYSYAHVLSCSPITEVAHQYWGGLRWRTIRQFGPIPPGRFQWTRWKGSVKRKRRVVVSAARQLGFFRARTLFFN